jgi:transposase
MGASIWGTLKSRVCILDERGEIVLQEWVETTPEAFFKRFHGETKTDIAMEVGTHSRWAPAIYWGGAVRKWWWPTQGS